MSDNEYVAIDREELKRLRADSAELARVREPVKACTHEFSDNGEFELHCHLCDFHIDATPSRELMDEASQMAFEAGGDNDGGYILTGDEFDQIIAHVVSQAIVEREVAFSAKAAPEGFALVPVEPTDGCRVEVGFEVIDRKHVPTVTIKMPPISAEDSKGWDRRDKAAQAIRAMLAAAPKGDSHE